MRLLLISLLLAATCRHSAPADLPMGEYSGEFIRSSPTARYAPAAVTLRITKAGYSGSSGKEYPVICEGTLAISGEKVTFHNTCQFTANFDWTYVLDGEFKLSVEGNTYTLVKDQGKGTMDTYVLRKK